MNELTIDAFVFGAVLKFSLRLGAYCYYLFCQNIHGMRKRDEFRDLHIHSYMLGRQNNANQVLCTGHALRFWNYSVKWRLGICRLLLYVALYV